MKGSLGVALVILGGLSVACVQRVEHHRGGDSGSQGLDACTSEAAFPRADQTGWRHAQAALTPYTGSLVLAAPVELVGVDIPTCISIRADGVILRRSRISAAGCSSSAVVTVDAPASASSVGTLLEDVEIDGLKTAIGGVEADSMVTLRRVDLHDVGMGVRQLTSDGVTLEESFLHEVRGTGSVIANSGYGGLTLCHNTLECPACASVLVALGDIGLVQDLLVSRNLIDGGNEYAIYAGSDPGKSHPVSKTTVFRGNRWARSFFSRGGRYGPVVDYDPSGEGNLWVDNAFLDPEEQILP